MFRESAGLDESGDNMPEESNILRSSRRPPNCSANFN